MKVHIGPYNNWIGPYQIADKIFFWIDRRGIFADNDPRLDRWDHKAHDKFGDWLAEFDWLCNLCNWVESKKKRKVKIRIDNYDTWSMDHTLSLIIHPMLVQMKATKHGSPFVDNEDVPEHLRSTAAPPLTEEEKNYGGTDSLHEARWDWILDEMIWAFYQEANEDPDAPESPIAYSRKIMDGVPFDDSPENRVSWEKFHEENAKFDKRKANAFKLFGRYYRALWD
jgi:hypothetical protein